MSIAKLGIRVPLRVHRTQISAHWRILFRYMLCQKRRDRLARQLVIAHDGYLRIRIVVLVAVLVPRSKSIIVVERRKHGHIRGAAVRTYVLDAGSKCGLRMHPISMGMGMSMVMHVRVLLCIYVVFAPCQLSC